jgi:glycosyltransferase 2 family protein
VSRGRGVSPVLRVLVSAGVLVLLLQVIDGADILSRLGRMDLRWAAAAVLLSVLQIMLLAWRWQFTARRLGSTLDYGDAFAEYYLGVFLNQVIPGGVMGDVARAWRQTGPSARSGAGSGAGSGAAITAVVLERASAQAIMTFAALVSTLVLLLRPSGTLHVVAGGSIALALAALFAAVVVQGMRALSSRGTLAGRIWRDAQAAVLQPQALVVHLVTGSVVVASYVGVFLAGALAVGVETSLLTLLPLVPPLLMTMLIPVSVAGWGIREGAAAALWGIAGLPASDGVLISVAYGVLVLVSSLPGGLVLLRARRR